MRPFLYQDASDAAGAVHAMAAHPGASDKRADGATAYLAGGTTLIDLMKLDVVRPAALVDINPLQADYGEIDAGPRGLRLGALARMADVADDARIQRDYPVVAQSLQLAAQRPDPQHGELGRQPAAAHPLLLLSRHQLQGLQQAHSGQRLRRS